MGSCCREVMEPSVKLARMITLLKILGIIHSSLIIGDIFLFGTSFFVLLLMKLLFLYISISTKYYGFYLMYILYGISIIGSCLANFGICFQRGNYKDHNYIGFGFLSFLFVFEIFCVYVVFQTYKQSKHEYRIKFGFVPGNNINENNVQNNDNIEGLMDNNDENEDNGNGNVNNNQEGFAPFQGNGIPVGGN